ncbi:MAG TPA: S41 family peptidase [Azospirillum sp.]
MSRLAVIALSVTLMSWSAVAEDFRGEVVRLLQQHWVGTVDPAAFPALEPAKANTVLRGLDPYLSYRPTAERDKSMLRASRNAVELGIEVVEDRVGVLVVRRRSVAAGADTGGAYLVSLDGRPVADIDGALRLLGRTDLPERVSLGLTHVPGGPVRKLHLRREEHEGPSVEVWEAGPFQVIRIFELVLGQTEKAVEAALRSSSTAERPVVLDLRYSIGGNPFSATLTAGLFSQARETLAYTARAGSDRVPMRNLAAFNDVNRNVTVLTSTATASAAEMLAMMLRGRKGVAVVGRATHGKCVIVGQFPLGGGVLSIPTAEVIGRHGETCHGTGVPPDILLAEDAIHDDDFIMASALTLVAQRNDLTCTVHPATTMEDALRDIRGAGGKGGAAVMIGKDRETAQIRLCSMPSGERGDIGKPVAALSQVRILRVPGGTGPASPPTEAVTPAAPAPPVPRVKPRPPAPPPPVLARTAPERAPAAARPEHPGSYASVFGTFEHLPNAEVRQREIARAMSTIGVDGQVHIVPVHTGRALFQVIAGRFSTRKDARRFCHLVENAIAKRAPRDCGSMPRHEHPDTAW